MAERAAAAARMADFVAWLDEHGVDMTKIDLLPARSGQSWGAFAACDLPAGASYATIPLTIALTEDVVLKSRTAMDAAKLGLAPSTRALTYTEMLLQRADQSSHFGPYLRAIPVCHTDPVSWPEKGRRTLRGSNLLPATRRILTELRAAYDGLVPALCEANPARYPVAVLHYSQFLWAHSSFVSRAFPLTPDANGQLRLSAGTTGVSSPGSEKFSTGSGTGRQQCLLPLLDMFNHKYAAPIVWQSGGASDCPTVGFASGRSLAKGQEIFNNYGPKSNEELLLTYGFVLQNNPHDTYCLEVAGLAAEDEEELQAKQALLVTLELPRRHTLCSPARSSKKRRRSSHDVSDGNLVLGQSGCIHADLLRVLRLALLNRVELLSLIDRSEAADVALAAPVSGRNEMAALKQLLALLRDKLNRLDGQMDDTGSISVESGPSTASEVWQPLVSMYLKQQRDLLQHGIAECKCRLHAVAAATTRLRSSRDWRIWNYAQSKRRHSDSGSSVLVIELPLSESGSATHTGNLSCETAVAMSRGILYATAEVSADAACLSMPLSELITVKAAKNTDEWGDLLSSVGGIDEDAILMLFLIHEEHKCRTGSGSSPSKWVDFLQHPLLQTSGGNSAPCAWSVAERALLNGTEAGDLVDEAQNQLKELHEALFPALTDAYPQAFPTAVYTLDALRWAASVLARYAVELHEIGTAIVPLLEAVPRHRVDGTCIHAIDKANSCYVMRTLRRVCCAEELTICIGRGGDRSRLLAETGVRLGNDAMSGGNEGGVLIKLIGVGESASTDGSVSEVRVTVTEPADGGSLLVWPPSVQNVLRDHDQSALRQRLYMSLLSHTQTVTQLHQQAESAAGQCESVEAPASVLCPGAAKDCGTISGAVARYCLEHLTADLAVLTASTAAAAVLIKLLD